MTRATPADWPGVQALLTDVDLPLDGAAEAFTTGIVARDDGRIIGCAAIEPYGTTGLLRSVAVASDRRRTGVGTAIISTVEAVSRDQGITDVILLTETAEPWFRSLGYESIDRSAVPRDVAGSIEFTTACSMSAVAMRRSLR